MKISNKSCEKFENGNWSDIPEAPEVGIEFDAYAVIFYSNNFYYFGGYNTSGLRSILSLNAVSWTWSKVGNLNSNRFNHGVILVENTFMVIGGLYNKANEFCILNNGQFTCEEKTSRLNNYVSTPLLFLVNDDYGIC